MEQFEGGYNESRPKRIREIVEHFGIDSFRGKSLLEVAAGFGHIGAEFATTYGANVLCTDARPEHVQRIISMHPQVKAAVQNLEEPWPFEEKFDFLLYLGVMHHIHPHHVPTALEEMCNAADKIAIDLEVTDGEDPELIVPQSEGAFDQSVHGMGSRPTTNYMERKFEEFGMQFKRVMDPRMNGPANFTWEPSQGPGGGARRFWLVWR